MLKVGSVHDLIKEAGFTMSECAVADLENAHLDNRATNGIRLVSRWTDSDSRSEDGKAKWILGFAITYDKKVLITKETLSSFEKNRSRCLDAAKA